MSRCSRLDQGKAVTMRSPEQVPVVCVVAVQHLARNLPSTVERSDSFLHRRVGRVGIEHSMCRLGRSYQCRRDTICGLLFLVICLQEGFAFFGSASQLFQAGTCKLPWTHEVNLFQLYVLCSENRHHLIPSDGVEFVIQLHQQAVSFELLLVGLEFLVVDALLDCARCLVYAALHLSYFSDWASSFSSFHLFHHFAQASPSALQSFHVVTKIVSFFNLWVSLLHVKVS